MFARSSGLLGQRRLHLVAFSVIDATDLKQHVADVRIIQVIRDRTGILRDFQHH